MTAPTSVTVPNSPVSGQTWATWNAGGTALNSLVKIANRLNARFYDATDLAYGATGDGSTDDTDAIQAALDQAASDGGGVVWLPVGTYSVTGLSIDTGVHLVGAGQSSTIITLADSSDANVIESQDYASLKAADEDDPDNGVPLDFGLHHLQIDGNKANQSSGHGVAIWGIHYLIEDVLIVDAKDDGFHSEFTTGVAGMASEVTSQIETRIVHLICRAAGGKGFYFAGPHDAFVDSLYALRCDGIGVEVADTVDINYVHSYANSQGFVGSGGVIRAQHIEAETNDAEGVVFNGVGGLSWVGRMTCFANHNTTDTPGVTDYSVVIQDRVQCSTAYIDVTDNGGSGVNLANQRCHFASLVVDATGSGTAGVGVNFAANKVRADVDVVGFTESGGIGVSFDNQGGSTPRQNWVTGHITNCDTLFKAGTSSGERNMIQLRLETSAGGQTPFDIVNDGTSNFIDIKTRGSHTTEYLRLTEPSSAYSVSNDSADRTYDADSTTLAELADVLATVISDLQDKGILG